MKVGETIWYRGYDITRHLQDDYVVQVGHDTQDDAKAWIDYLIEIDQLEEVKSDK